MNSKNSERLLPDKGRENREIGLWDYRVGINSYENLLVRDVTRAQDTRTVSKCTIFYIISIILLILALMISVYLHHLKSSPKHYNSPESSTGANQVIKEGFDNETIPELKLRFWVIHNNEAVDSDATSGIDLKEESHCKPIHNNITIIKPFRKSLQKCLEYQRRYVYPCRESATPYEGMVRLNHCNWRPEGLIIDGENAYLGEFPHMALLGYDTVDDDDKKWKCGGVLVSEKFVLTAAHCTSTAARKKVKYVRIGILLRNETITSTNMYTVKQTYKYPKYRAPLRYNDIALLEMNKVIELHRNALPACLHDGSRIDESAVIATGWGTINTKQIFFPNNLQKVTLKKYPDEYCGLQYAQLRLLPLGYGKNTQVCYGDKYSSRDTCKGDSGGPIQIRHPQVKCMYLITGVTSTGKGCGHATIPGLYIRVAPYLDWIESIVWPN